MLIRRWMTSNPITISPGQTLAEAQRKMQSGNFRRLPVVKNDQLLGIISDRDLRQYVGQLEHTRVEAVMVWPVITVSPDMLLDEAVRLLVKHKFGGLPVVSGAKLVGMITTIDLLRAWESERYR